MSQGGKHKKRFANGDRVCSVGQLDFCGTVVGESHNGLVVKWDNGFTLSESTASLAPAGTQSTYELEMFERHYIYNIMRDGECVVGDLQDYQAEIVAAELNTLAAENARLREALEAWLHFYQDALDACDRRGDERMKEVMLKTHGTRVGLTRDALNK